jgi:AcrR family transcriptional regulator
MATASSQLSGDKAQRIVEAMRTCVAARGAAGATFDHVAREAGVSRGLLHYYFGTKERLLAEVVRRDCDLRMARLSETAAGAGSADALLVALAGSLEQMMRDEPEFMALLLELHTAARSNAEIAGEVAQLHRRVREHLAGILAGAQVAGAVELAASPEVVAEVLFSLADGLGMRMLVEPERDYGATVGGALLAAGALVRPR